MHGMFEFGSALHAARVAGELTQVELSERSGVARPNITAYESGRRELLFHGALELLAAAGAEATIEAQMAWSWILTLRPKTATSS